MFRRTIIIAGAALVLAGVPLAATNASASSAQTRCGKPDVSVTHNRTSTTAHINFNPCNRWWVWPWASFIDQDGNPDRDSVPGVKHGNPVVYEPNARKNVLGGYGYSDTSGTIHNVQTYG